MFGEAREIEGQLAADDQLFQKFVGQELVLPRVVLDSECHFER